MDQANQMKWLETGLKEHKHAAYRICLRVLGNAPDAEDAFQNATLVLMRRLHEFRPGTSMRGWICAHMHRQAVNLAVDRKRRTRLAQGAMQRQVTMESAQTSLEKVAQLEQTQRLRQALATLSVSDRAAVELRYLEGMSDAEVAQALGCRAKAANKRIRRALNRLRERLGQAVTVALLLSLLGDMARAEEWGRAPAALDDWIDKTFAAPPVSPMSGWERFMEGVIDMARNPVTIAALVLVCAGAYFLNTGAPSRGEEGVDIVARVPSDERRSSPAAADLAARKAPTAANPNKAKPEAPVTPADKGQAEEGAAPRWLPPRVILAKANRISLATALSAHGGRVALLIEDQPAPHASGEGRGGLLLATSADHGAHWAEPRKILGQAVAAGSAMRKGRLQLALIDRSPVSMLDRPFEQKTIKLSYTSLTADGDDSELHGLGSFNSFNVPMGQLPAALVAYDDKLAIFNVDRTISLKDGENGGVRRSIATRLSLDGGRSWEVSSSCPGQSMDARQAIREGLCPVRTANVVGCLMADEGAVGAHDQTAKDPGKWRCPLLFWSSRDEGKTWSTRPLAIYGAPLGSEMPDDVLPVAVKSLKKRVFLLVQALNSQQRSFSYYLATSDNEGATWNEALPVSEMLLGDTLRPSMDARGQEIVIAYLSLNLPAGLSKRERVARMTRGPRHLQVRVIRSADGGKTWMNLHFASGLRVSTMHPRIALDSVTGDIHIAAQTAIGSTPKTERIAVVVRSFTSAKVTPSAPDPDLAAIFREVLPVKPTPQQF